MTAVRLGQVLALLVAAALAAPAIAAPGAGMRERVEPCLACHAPAKLDLGAGYVPRLHGKPAGYLYNQLLNYREGRRYHHAMVHMVRNLSDAYLWEMAQYFAAQEEPYALLEAEVSEALAARAQELIRRGDPQLGVPSCQACHGERLTGVEPNTPGLLGLPRHYIAAQLGAWRAGTRRAAEPDCMAELAKRLSPHDIRAVANWIAAEPVPADTTPAAEPVAEPPMECGSVPLPGQ